MCAKVGDSWVDRRVIAYAHQGGAWEAPSSTLYAIEKALETGASGIELDVHATRDRELVVCHDSSVDRTTDRSGLIANMTLAELRELDNSYWFVPGADVTPGLDPSDYPYRGKAPGDRSFGIATLEEALGVIATYPGVVVNLDIKGTAPEVEPYEELLARQLAELGWADDVIVASFKDLATEAFRRFAPHIATSAGTVGTALFWRAVHTDGELPPTPYAALQVPVTHEGLDVVDEKLIEAAHRRGIAVHVWTVNDASEMDRLLELGVDGIISDLPTALCELVEDKGVAWRPDGRR